MRENGRQQQRSLHHQAKHGEWIPGFNVFGPAASDYVQAAARTYVRAGKSSSARRAFRLTSLPRAPDPRKRPRTRRENDDQPEVVDEQPYNKGCDEPED